MIFSVRKISRLPPLERLRAGEQLRLRTPSLYAIATYGRKAGSARVRLFDWLDHLEITANEATFTEAASVSAKHVLRNPSTAIRAELRLSRISREHPPHLFLSRRASPFARGRLESRLLTSAGRGVYDFDDALWLHRAGPFPLERTWRRSVEAADVVIAGNEMLAAEAREHAAHVVMIPSCVEPADYVRKTDYTIDAPRAVWIGSPSTEKYLLQIAAPLRELHRDTGLRLTVISAGDADLGPLSPMIDRVTWHPSTYAAELAAADFGIMPLDDTDWSRGKCAYKLLQYGAAAQIAVASPVGANRLALDRMNGLTASDDAEWFTAMNTALSLTRAQREDRGARARSAVEQHYSFDAWRDAWVDAVFGGSGIPGA